jgi:dinuclear metal center YbgI/SA1388 family protein
VKAKGVLDIIDSLAPFSLALPWDNSGIQTGDPDRPVKKIAVCLDPSPEAVDEAVSAKADLLVAHHPLIFKPLKSLVSGRPETKALLAAIKAGLAVISAHTNWDAAGMAPALAELLELKPEGFLEPCAPELLKIIVFAPLGSERDITEALFDAGAGQIGAYSRCSYRAEGLGGFLPPSDGNPHIGDPEVYTETAEYRIEAVLPERLKESCARAVRQYHPYEEPAFEFYKTITSGSYGFGLTGVWDPPRDPLAWISEKLSLKNLVTAGPIPSKVSKAALLPGSGASYIPQAKARGAEILVTGDLTHHQALTARELGLGVISAGHHETELPGARKLKDELSRRIPEAEFLMILPESPMPVWRAP